MRILLTLEYDGTAYAGWQRQENALAVQQVVEEAVSRLVGERTVLFGASRTDAGVHALGQRAHFDTASRIPPDKYAYALNTMLPRDIRVRESRAVADDLHARFSAVGKQYRYQIYSAPHAGALNRNTHAHVIYPLDAEKMRAELPALLGRHDFAAFAASGSVVKDTVRRVTPRRTSRRRPGICALYRGHGLFVQHGAHHCRHAHRRGHGQTAAGRVLPRAYLKEPPRSRRHRPRARTHAHGGILR